MCTTCGCGVGDTRIEARLSTPFSIGTSRRRQRSFAPPTPRRRTCARAEAAADPAGAHWHRHLDGTRHSHPDAHRTATLTARCTATLTAHSTATCMARKCAG